MVKNILVLEDEIAIRIAVEVQLAGDGRRVIGTSQFSEMKKAVDDLKDAAESLDLAVVDLWIPLRDTCVADGGFVTASYIQSQFPDTPIIVLTIRTDWSSLDKAKAMPSIRYYIAKPWRSEMLRDAAELCLRGQSSGFTPIGLKDLEQ